MRNAQEEEEEDEERGVDVEKLSVRWEYRLFLIDNFFHTVNVNSNKLVCLCASAMIPTRADRRNTARQLLKHAIICHMS